MAASASRNNADGTVIEITQGSVELESLLQSAATHRQLLLLDYTVSWCGPCRMLAPVLIQIAQENRGKVVVAKMDCEKTPANQSLAASSSINAYPTLKIFRDRSVASTLRGANPAALRQAIAEQLSILGPSAGRQAAPGALATALALALGKMKAACSYEEFVTALGSKKGGRECMEILGFSERTEAMEAVLVMDEINPQLPSVISLLQHAVAQAPPATAPPTTAAHSTDAPNAPVSAAAERQGEASVREDALAETTRVSVPSHQGGAAGAATVQGESSPPPRAGGTPATVQSGSGPAVTPAMLAEILERALRDSGLN